MSSTLPAQASASVRGNLPDSTCACLAPAMPRLSLCTRTMPDVSRRR